MIRVLLDQGVGHSAGPELAAAGWDVKHVRDIGLQQASDRVILDHARDDQHTAFLTYRCGLIGRIVAGTATGTSSPRVR